LLCGNQRKKAFVDMFLKGFDKIAALASSRKAIPKNTSTVGKAEFIVVIIGNAEITGCYSLSKHV